MEHGKLADLRAMLHQMELAFGLHQLSDLQRDVYYAACILAREAKVFNSDDLRRQPLVAPIPRSTFFRVLKDLNRSGYLRPVGHGRSGQYEVAG